VKFLVDENIFPPVISHLRNLGHNVKGIQESGLFQVTDREKGMGNNFSGLFN
jgi:hypothetical protein